MTTDEWADYLDPDSSDPSLSVDDRAMLDRARATLADEHTWDGPSAGLEARIMREAGLGPGTHDPAPAAPVATPAVIDEVARRRAARRWARPLAGIAVAAAVAIIAFVSLFRGEESPVPPDDVFVVAGTELAPEAAATAEVWSRGAGDAITLTITGLRAAPTDTYYSAWVSGPDGTVPVGSFHWRESGAAIELWSGVDTAAYPNFMVTLQREGQPPARSKQVVLRGTLEP